MTNKNLLFIFRSAPYSSPMAQEGLDALMAAAIFDQNVSVIFMSDGVWQLQPNQRPSAGKNMEKMLRALEMYNINQLYVQTSALQERRINPQYLSINCTQVTDSEIRQIMSGADHILSF